MSMSVCSFIFSLSSSKTTHQFSSNYLCVRLGARVSGVPSLKSFEWVIFIFWIKFVLHSVCRGRGAYTQDTWTFSFHSEPYICFSSLSNGTITMPIYYIHTILILQYFFALLPYFWMDISDFIYLFIYCKDLVHLHVSALKKYTFLWT